MSASEQLAPEHATNQGSYQRLPRGPHRLARSEVLSHQDRRIRGAMARAVAEDGYHATTVRQVLRIAGVSRRSFYEHYPNREACFLATLDAIATRWLRTLRRAVLSSAGTRDAVDAALPALSAAWAFDPDALAVVAREAQHAGRGATVRLRLLTARCGRLLADAAGEPGAARSQARDILAQALAGGVLGGISRHAGAPSPPLGLADDVRRWALLIDARSATRAPAPRQAGAEQRDCDPRERLLDVALAVALQGRLARLTTAELADAAGMHVDGILERFAHPLDCYLAALDSVGERARAVLAARPSEPAAADSSRAMLSLEALLAHLGRHALDAHTLGYAAFTAGPVAAARVSALARELAAQVIAVEVGAFDVDALAGALVHVVGCLALRGRTERLPGVSRHLWPVIRAVSAGAG